MALSDKELSLAVSFVMAGDGPAIEPDASLEERARQCFRAAFDRDRTWFVALDDLDGRFRIGVGALLVHLDRHAMASDTRRVENTLRMMKALGAAVLGVPVNWEALLEETVDEDEKPAPLQKWFMEVKADLEREI